MEYLLKSVLISGVIYLFYKAFLQKETFFQSIRWYFNIGIIATILLPILIIPIYIEIEPVVQTLQEMPINIYETSVQAQEYIPVIEVEKTFDWIYLIKGIYVVGAVFFFLKFIMELFSLTRIINISKKRKEGKYHFVETNLEISPFSFFNYIVYNKKQFNAKELRDIIAHEKVHVDQKHSLDNIIVQLFVITQWFNPLVWLYKKEVLQNIEYIADKEAQEKAETYKKYQYLLLKTSIKNNPFALSNNFFNSQLKKRIMMLQKSQTKKINQLKYVLLIPLLALFLYAFNTKEILIPKKVDGESIQVESRGLLDFVNPIQKDNVTGITSGYGIRIHPITKEKKMHLGIDIRAYKDMDVYATANGVIITAAFDKQKGNYIQVRHANDYQTNYHHLGNIQVEVGEQVQAGEIIGIVGNTGASVGIHLHYEIMKNGKNINPKMYLNYGKVSNIIIRSATTESEINEFNEQFANLENRIRITNVKRNKDNEIKGFTIQTKFENESFKNNLSIDTEDKIMQAVQVEAINNKSSFRIIHTAFGKNRIIIIDKNGSIGSSELKKNKPSAIEINNWKNAKKYGVWIDGKKVGNGELKKYAANDFSSYYVSKLAKNAINYDKYSYQVDLMTNAYYNQYIKNKRNKFAKKGQYRVKKGDTYYSIAKKNNISVSELKRLNAGLNGKLVIGVYLRVQSNGNVKTKNSTRVEVLVSKTTSDTELKAYAEVFKDLGVVLKIYEVKRNKNNEIIAIKIDGKSKNTSATFSYEQNEPISKVRITYDKESDEINIENVNRRNGGQTMMYTVINEDEIKEKDGLEIIEIVEDLENGQEGNKMEVYILNGKQITKKEYEHIEKSKIKKSTITKISKTSSESVVHSSGENNTITGSIKYKGETYYYTKNKNQNISCSGECDDIISKLSEKDQKKVKKIKKDGKTYNLYENVTKITFFDKFGSTTGIKLTKKLIKALKKQ